jgi:propionate CoA-transferase
VPLGAGSKDHGNDCWQPVEAYNQPQGQLYHLYRTMSCGLPGKKSKVGLGTYIDPRVEGGKMNARTKALPISSKSNYGGEEYLFL